MDYENAIWADAEKNTVQVDFRGKTVFVPKGNIHFAKMADQGVKIAKNVAPKEPPRRLPKLLVIDRLQASGKFGLALDALKADPLNYERWSASQTVNVEDAAVLGLMAVIGADVTVILAPEDD